MNRLHTAAAAASLTLSSAALAAETTWRLDPDHSEVGFRVRHMMVSWTKGRFERFDGTLTLDDARPEQLRLDVTIDAGSVNTHLPKRDEHLRSADFFDVARYPSLRFVSRRVVPRENGRLSVIGDLSLRGVTREVVLEVTHLGRARRDPWGGTRRGATATAQLHRKDFGLVWNGALEGGGVLVGDEVTIQLEVELLQNPPPTAQK